jgi:L-amino acid N-acyltransferase YncA
MAGNTPGPPPASPPRRGDSCRVIRQVDTARDAARCAQILAPYADGPETFLDRAPSAAEMRRAIGQTTATHPWLVAERDDLVVGYAYAGPHRTRPAYRWAAEVSVYVDRAFMRQGVGRALYDELLARLRRQRLHVAVAGISLPNPGSVALHEAVGFTPIGVFRDIGWKAGAWRSVGWWQLILGSGPGGDGDPTPPPEPVRQARE